MAKLLQNLSCVKGLTEEKVRELGTFKMYEVLTEADIVDLERLSADEHIGMYIKSMLMDNVLEVPEIREIVNALNSKRIFRYFLDGEKYFLVLSQKRELTDGKLNHMNAALLKAARNYFEYEKAPAEEKEERLNRFISSRNSLMLMIEKQIFSKSFKTMYKMEFHGVSGVALTGNCQLDEIEIPEWYAKKHGIKIGDVGIIYRDPVQNLFFTVIVKGFTKNEIRVNSQMFTWLGGDHDGDKCQFLPLSKLIEDNLDYISTSDIDNIIREALRLLPSRMQYDGQFSYLIDPEAMKEVVVSEELDTPHSMLEMLESSSKSMKYAEAIEEESYVENQAGTILNMRTVKEGTAFAGAFANWIFDKARNHGLDLTVARHLGNLIQQEALDSKHTTGGKGYQDAKWYKITELQYKCNKDSFEEIMKKIEAIMNDEEVKEDKKSGNDDFEL